MFMKLNKQPVRYRKGHEIKSKKPNKLALRMMGLFKRPSSVHEEAVDYPCAIGQGLGCKNRNSPKRKQHENTKIHSRVH